ncbi:hypothetical protein Taro_032848, partial [Colocasia esculenta]|nr:hypothetical protein [Colocasia esculenta]
MDLMQRCGALLAVEEFVQEAVILNIEAQHEEEGLDDGFGVYEILAEEDPMNEEDGKIEDVAEMTPKTHRCLNTLHPNPRDEFRTCWGRVEELLVAEELWNDHKKLIFFPVASAVTCTDSHLEVDQRRRPCEGDGPTGHVLRSCHDSIHRRVLKAMKRSVTTVLPDLTTLSRSSHHLVAFCSRPVATLTGACRNLTPGLIA